MTLPTADADFKIDTENLSFGMASSGGLILPGFHNIDVAARITFPVTLELAALRYTKRIYLETQLGYVGRYYYHHFYLSLSGGIAELPFNSQIGPVADAYIPVSSSFGFDSLIKRCTKIDLENTLNYHFMENKIEDRIGLF